MLTQKKETAESNLKQLVQPSQKISQFEEDKEQEQRVLQQQKKNVKYLALCYLTLFIAFNSTQNLVSSLYKQQGYEYLGLISLLFIYTLFALMSLLAKSIIRRFSYQIIFSVSALGYTSFVLSGILVFSCSNSDEGICSPTIIYAVVILCSCFCGATSATLWVGQGGYMESIFALIKSEKGNISGIFWSIRQLSHIVGNISAMIILNIVDNNIYFFLIMGIVSLTASVMFYYVAKVDQPKLSHYELKQQLLESQNSRKLSELPPIHEQIKRVFRLIKSNKFQPFLYLTVLGGIALAFSSGFQRNLVKVSVEGSDKEIAQSLSFVLITFGIFEYVGGKVAGMLADRFSAYYLATIGTLIILLGLLLSFIGLITKSYLICFLISSVFGFVDCYLNIVSQVISNNDYKGQLEVFQAQRFVFAVANACTQVLLILLIDFPNYTFLTIVFIIALISNFVVSLFPVLSQQEQKLSNDTC